MFPGRAIGIGAAQAAFWIWGSLFSISTISPGDLQRDALWVSRLFLILVAFQTKANADAIDPAKVPAIDASDFNIFASAILLSDNEGDPRRFPTGISMPSIL